MGAAQLRSPAEARRAALSQEPAQPDTLAARRLHQDSGRTRGMNFLRVFLYILRFSCANTGVFKPAFPYLLDFNIVTSQNSLLMSD